MTREAEQQISDLDDDAVPMKPQLFELAAAEIQSHRDAPELQAAVRAVLVDGMKVGEAAEHWGIPQSNISRRASRIQEQLQAIADREGWVLATYMLPAPMQPIMDEFEAFTVAPLLLKQSKKKKQRKPE